VRARARREGYTEAAQLREALRARAPRGAQATRRPAGVDAHRPFVIMLAGVNGSGKTTSIGKLATYYQEHGKSVHARRGDTFARRPGAARAWGERNNVTVISQQSGDAAA
jgi:fused signal recognition particle receptor